MFIIKYRNIFFAITGILVAASVVSIALFGLRLGIDCTGGTLVDVSYEAIRPTTEVVSDSLKASGLEGFSLRESGELGYTLRAGKLTDKQRSFLAAMFTIGDNSARVDQLSEIGPTIGKELRNKSFIALALVLLCILFFIAFAFRKVSQPVSSWMYGLIALIALIHDVIVPVGFYAALGHFV